MDYEKALTLASLVETGESVRVCIDIATGTYHRLALYEKSPNGPYKQGWVQTHLSGIGGLRIEAKAGSIVHQRTLSPARAEPLERYGVVLTGGKVDWGAEADWVVDFGPAGSVTRRALRSPNFPVKRGRVVAPHGEEVVGGAVSDASTTSGD